MEVDDLLWQPLKGGAERRQLQHLRSTTISVITPVFDWSTCRHSDEVYSTLVSLWLQWLYDDTSQQEFWRTVYKMGEEGDSLLPTTARTLAKKGYIKKQNKKIVQKLLCVSYHHQHPQQVVFVNVHVYGTTELKRAEKHYETTCVQHPPPHPPFLRSSSHYPINKKMAWFHLADLVSGFLVLCKLAHWVTWKTWLLFVLLVTPVLTYYESQHYVVCTIQISLVLTHIPKVISSFNWKIAYSWNTRARAYTSVNLLHICKLHYEAAWNPWARWGWPCGYACIYGEIGGGHSDLLRMVKGVLIWACVHKEESVFN